MSTEQNKSRTNVSLTGDDIELLNIIKTIIADRSKTKQLAPSAQIVRSALEHYRDILIKG